MSPARAALLLPLAALAALPAFGDRPAEEKVEISVVAVFASDQCDKIDPKLICVAKKVREVDPKLTGFRVGKLANRSLAVGETAEFPLVGDQTATVCVLRGADKDDRVQLKVTPPQMGEITYDTACGKFFPVITAYRTPGGEVLILAVRVGPCNGK
jgi:hypothetical protein